MRSRQLLAARFECVSALAIYKASYGFCQRRKRRFSIRGHRDIDFGIAFEVLVVRLDEQIAGRDADELRTGFRGRTRTTLQLIAIRIHSAPEIRQLES